MGSVPTLDTRDVKPGVAVLESFDGTNMYLSYII